MNHVSAYKLLYKFARNCGAKEPHLLRCNLLKSQMATECQNLNLDDAALHDLANYMSHDVRIHKSIYRKDIVLASDNFPPKKDIVERNIPILLNFITAANGIEDDVLELDENFNGKNLSLIFSFKSNRL